MRFSRSRLRGVARALLLSTILSPPGPAALANETSSTAATALPIPPAPDQKVAPEAYDHWRRYVETPFARGWIKSGHPLARSSNGAFATARLMDTAPAPAPGGVIHRTSGNWSGAVFHDKTQQPFKVEAIIGEFVVPNARQPIGVCDSRHSSYWVGIDGYGSHMLLQTGVSARSECKNGVENAHYSAWIEWLPADSVPVSRPEVRPGDLMFLEIWSASPQKGFAYLYNHSRREGAVYTLTPPSPGDALKGGSVEWILERPTRDKVREKLANYSAASMPFGVAWNYQSATPAYYYPGAPRQPLEGEPPPPPLHLLRMTDDNRRVISTPYVENDHFLFFLNSGSSASAQQ